MFGRKSNIKADGFLVFVYSSDEAETRGFYEAFHTFLAFLVTLLVTLIGLHLQPLSISPLEKHFAIILFFIGAIIIYGIAYMLTKLQARGSEYLYKLRFIRLVFGIIAIALLASIIISPFWLSMVILCSILIVGVPCLYKQIYQLVYRIWLADIPIRSISSILFKGTRRQR